MDDTKGSVKMRLEKRNSEWVESFLPLSDDMVEQRLSRLVQLARQQPRDDGNG